MYINAVLSYLGAWEKMQTQYPDFRTEIKLLISQIKHETFAIEWLQFDDNDPLRYSYSPRNLSKELRRVFSAAGWHPEHGLRKGKRGRRQYSEIDAVKNGIGIDFVFRHGTYVESDLFVKFPVFARTQKITMALVFVPVTSIAKDMPGDITPFEAISERIQELSPLPLKYPFAVIGLDDDLVNPDKVLEYIEMTSELDQFLIESTGRSLDEMRLIGEAANYDFKERVPDNKKVAHEVCAFANLSGGGLILIGIDNTGRSVGMLRTELDGVQLSITNTIKSLCAPRPEIDFKIFDVPEHDDRCVLVVQISELARKPCMVDGRAYIRTGASARPAGPDEIRRLVLGSD